MKIPIEQTYRMVKTLKLWKNVNKLKLVSLPLEPRKKTEVNNAIKHQFCYPKTSWKKAYTEGNGLATTLNFLTG